MNEALLPKTEGRILHLEVLTWRVFMAELQRVSSVASPFMAATISQHFLQTISIIMAGQFVFKSGLGYNGAALALSLSYWLSVILLGIYMKFSSSCEKTRVLVPTDVFLSIKEWFYFAIPSALMICLELCSFQSLIVQIGLLPNLQLETSVLSICFTTVSLHYFIPFGISAATSIRVSNKLGAGNPHAARMASYAAMALTLAESVVISTILFCYRHVFGISVAKMVPLMCLSIIMDSLHVVLNGIIRGIGLQHVAVYANLGAYYFFGIPMGILFGFILELRGAGLWIGMLTGSIVQKILLSLVVIFTNWKNSREPRAWGSNLIMEEVKKVILIAAPMAVVTVSRYLLQLVAVMMAGHLGELPLSGVALASSFANVTGFSVLLGMAGALETLCGQAYGAEQYHKLGTFTFSAMISLAIVSIPVSVLWIFMENILTLLGQDPLIAHEAGKYSCWLIPALFGFAILQSLIRYFLAQSLILPMLLSSCLVLCFHVPLCWILVFKLDLGIEGSALSVGVSYWLNVIFLGFYIKYSSTCKKTSSFWISEDMLITIKEFFRLAIPSALMMCLEWWSFEILVLLSGLLPNPQLQTSAISICLTITTLHFLIPFSIASAASFRISNELGAWNPHAVPITVTVALILNTVEVIIVSLILFFCRQYLGYAYTTSKEVVHYTAELIPLLCLMLIADSLQAILSGVARGSGWQHIGAYVNLGAYYLVGVPLAAVLSFIFHFEVKGNHRKGKNIGRDILMIKSY
ncbi:Multi antimicrobial extrusion protein [Corchorus capsularis]|uniref:Protein DETOXIFICATION n=1 Tax=Corchorus capsularis TaxID=210143 RepID=A0A1R3GC12_COCAP|nr:Multi antimicrobial extrusion protein [Corchorus capsularis]